METNHPILSKYYSKYNKNGGNALRRAATTAALIAKEAKLTPEDYKAIQKMVVQGVPKKIIKGKLKEIADENGDVEGVLKKSVGKLLGPKYDYMGRVGNLSINNPYSHYNIPDRPPPLSSFNPPSYSSYNQKPNQEILRN